jgi:hypothetical protein
LSSHFSSRLPPLAIENAPPGNFPHPPFNAFLRSVSTFLPPHFSFPNDCSSRWRALFLTIAILTQEIRAAILPKCTQPQVRHANKGGSWGVAIQTSGGMILKGIF